MNRAAPTALLLAALLLPSAGCSLFSDDIDPVYEIEDDEYLVVYPVKEPDFSSAWDSPTGHELALLVSERLGANVDFHVSSYGNVLELLVAPPARNTTDGPVGDEKIGLDVREITPRKLADVVGSDYVLVCEIKKFELRDPLNINMSRATGVVEAKLFKIAKTKAQQEYADEEAARQKRMENARRQLNLDPTGINPYGGSFVAVNSVTAFYPNDYMGQYGETFADPADMRRGLLGELARKVAQLYYSHPPEKVPGSRN